MKKASALLIFCLASTTLLWAGGSNPTFRTYQSTRILNAHSHEVLAKRMLDFRISHRFGDIGGAGGSHHTLWGLDQARDIRISLEYGITDKLMVGLGRSKGAGTITEIFDGFIKYNILNQFADNEPPVSLTIVGTSSYTGMASSNDIRSATNFDQMSDRLAYTSQFIVSRKFGDRLALSATGAYTHRNLVGSDDQNGLGSVGAGGLVRVTKMTSITFEYFYPLFENNIINGIEHHHPLAFGLEVNTGGHLFQLHLSNSGGIGENQILPYTTSSWLDGQFRAGFTISRKFKL